MPAPKTVDEYIGRQDRFGAEVARLRDILLRTGLDETVKWGSPAYMHKGKNVVGIAAFKEHFALWFFQGALLSDPEGLLGVSERSSAKAMRQWRMESKKDIKAKAIASYVKEAVAAGGGQADQAEEAGDEGLGRTAAGARGGAEEASEGEEGVRRAHAGQAAGVCELHRRGKARCDEAEPDRENPAHDRGGGGLARQVPELLMGLRIAPRVV